MGRNTSNFLVLRIFAPLDEIIDFFMGLKEGKPVNPIHNFVGTGFRKILKFSVMKSNQQ